MLDYNTIYLDIKNEFTSLEITTCVNTFFPENFEEELKQFLSIFGKIEGNFYIDKNYVLIPKFIKEYKDPKENFSIYQYSGFTKPLDLHNFFWESILLFDFHTIINYKKNNLTIRMKVKEYKDSITICEKLCDKLNNVKKLIKY